MSRVLNPGLPRISVLLAAVGILSACQTGAQRELVRMRGEYATAKAEGDTCTAAVKADPNFDPIASFVPVKVNEPTMMMMANETRPTPAQAALVAHWRDAAQRCGAIWLTHAQQANPLYGSTLATVQQQSAMIYVDLVERRITWGEANRRLTKTRLDFRRDMQHAVAAVDGRLEAEHRDELARRAAAAQALNAAIQQQQIINQQQQMINNMNRPVNTTCNRFGNAVNCSTW